MAIEADDNPTPQPAELHGAIEMAACDLIASARAIVLMTEHPDATTTARAASVCAAVQIVALPLLARAESLLSGLDRARPVQERFAFLRGEA